MILILLSNLKLKTIKQMINNIAKSVEIFNDQINIKGKTTENLKVEKKSIYASYMVLLERRIKNDKLFICCYFGHWIN